MFLSSEELIQNGLLSVSGEMNGGFFFLIRITFPNQISTIHVFSEESFELRSLQNSRAAYSARVSTTGTYQASQTDC